MAKKFDNLVSIAFTSAFENLNIIEKALSTIRQRDIHIIVAFFGEEDASNILCKVSDDSKCITVALDVHDTMSFSGHLNFFI